MKLLKTLQSRKIEKVVVRRQEHIRTNRFQVYVEKRPVGDLGYA